MSTSKRPPDIMSLEEAARRVLAVARNSDLPLGRLAVRENVGDPKHWFAQSILNIVQSLGRRPDQSERQTLEPEEIADLELSNDLDSLAATGEGKPRFVELATRRSELDRYIRWMRTVQ